MKKIQSKINMFCHPAHDEQEQLLQQHRYRAAATAAAALSMYRYMPGI